MPGCRGLQLCLTPLIKVLYYLSLLRLRADCILNIANAKYLDFADARAFGAAIAHSGQDVICELRPRDQSVL